MEKVAILFREGTFDSLVTGLNFASAAASAGLKVRLFFSDWAAEKLRKDKVNEVNLPTSHSHRREWYESKIKESGFPGIRQMLSQIKELTDAKIYVCSLAANLWSLNEENIIPEVDEITGILSFLAEDLIDANVVISF